MAGDSMEINEDEKDQETEYIEQTRRLHEVEAKLKEYEQSFNVVSEQVQQEFAEMEQAIQIERQKSAKAVNIASRVYRQNTLLRKSRRHSSRSDARRRWARESSKDNGMMVPAVVVLENKAMDPEQLEALPAATAEEDLEEDDVVDKELAELKNETPIPIVSSFDLRLENQELQERLDNVLDENAKLKEKVEHHKKMEVAATSELTALKDRLEVESQVRKKAETFAAQMYGENKSWMRQSMIRNKTKKTDDHGESKLQDALQANKDLSEELEKVKMENHQKIEDLEEKVASLRDQASLKEENEILNSKIVELTNENEKIEAKNKELEMKLDEQQHSKIEASQPSTIPPPPPPPSTIPPPPPLLSNPSPGPGSGPSANPLQDLQKLVNQRRQERLKKEGAEGGGSDALNSPSKPKGRAPVNYADAMTEMMNRIKMGNVALKSPKRRMSEAQQAGELSPLAQENGDENADKDIYNTFRQGLKPARKSPNRRRISEPAAPSNFTFPQRRHVSEVENIDQEEDEEEQPNKFLAALKSPVKLRMRNDIVSRDSVKHPKHMSPELKAILDRKRNQSKQNSTTDLTK